MPNDKVRDAIERALGLEERGIVHPRDISEALKDFALTLNALAAEPAVRKMMDDAYKSEQVAEAWGGQDAEHKSAMRAALRALAEANMVDGWEELK